MESSRCIVHQLGLRVYTKRTKLLLPDKCQVWDWKEGMTLDRTSWRVQVEERDQNFRKIHTGK